MITSMKIEIIFFFFNSSIAPPIHRLSSPIVENCCFICVSVEKPSEAEGHNSFEKALTIPLRSPQKQRATIPFKPLSFSLFCFNTRNLLSLGGFQVGGGINSDNSLQYIEEGAIHVIVTSYVFNNGQNLERLKDLVRVVGKERLVLDLSCRKRVNAIVTDRWQKFSDVYLDKEILDFLAKYADEFLVHGVDVEGKKYLHELLTQRDEFDTIALLIRHLHIIVKDQTLYVLKWLIIYRVWLPT
ncbi:hypothetical protein ABKV19_021262 [Rosa sericea]